MKEKDPFRFNCFDFVLCSEYLFESLFPVKTGQKHYSVPMNKRHSAADVRKFCQFGPCQREFLSPSLSYCSPNSSARHKCMGIDQIMTLKRTVKERDKICIGYGALVWEAYRKRADLLRDEELSSLHKYAGVIISKQNKSKCSFILHENARKDSRERYKNFYFVSPECEEYTNDDGNLSCKKYESCFRILKSITCGQKT